MSESPEQREDRLYERLNKLVMLVAVLIIGAALVMLRLIPFAVEHPEAFDARIAVALGIVLLLAGYVLAMWSSKLALALARQWLSRG